MRKHFDEDLNILRQELFQMGKLCEEAIRVVTAELKGEAAGLEDVQNLEAKIDEKEREIEHRCMKLLLLQQPLAQDLRTVSATLKIISDLERVGDQALDIDELIPYISVMNKNNLCIVIEMIEQCLKMVSESIMSYAGHDSILARQVIMEDDIVDGLYVKQKEELVRLFETAHPDAEAGLDLLIIAKYLERIGDHATNVAEWALYSVEGSRES